LGTLRPNNRKRNQSQSAHHRRKENSRRCLFRSFAPSYYLERVVVVWNETPKNEMEQQSATATTYGAQLGLEHTCAMMAPTQGDELMINRRFESPSAAAFHRLHEIMQAGFDELEEHERQREQRVRQLHQQNLQMNEMLQQLLTTFHHPSGAPSPPTQSVTTATTNLVTPPAAAAVAATIRHESPPPTTKILAAVSSPPPLQQQQQPVAAGPVGAVAPSTPVMHHPSVDLSLSEDLPVVPIFFIVDNTTLPATFAALLDEYQRHGLWRYKKIKKGGWKTTHWNNNDCLRFALHQRQYFYDQIEREAVQQAIVYRRNNNGCRQKKAWSVRLAAAAVTLDQKYKNQSLDQAMTAMKKAADSTVKLSRKRPVPSWK
jgi:hypothetical protein